MIDEAPTSQMPTEEPTEPMTHVEPTHLFTGPSLRFHLAQSLANALDGLHEMDLSKCDDAQEWAEHLAEFHLLDIPGVDWKQGRVAVIEGEVWLFLRRTPENRDRGIAIVFNEENQMVFRMQPEVPLPPGGIRGSFNDIELIVRFHTPEQASQTQESIEANLEAMRAIRDSFRPIFIELVTAEVQRCLDRNAADQDLLRQLVEQWDAKKIQRVRGRTADPKKLG